MLLTSELVAVLGSEGCSAVSLVRSPRGQQPSTPETTQTVSRCCQMAPGLGHPRDPPCGCSSLRQTAWQEVEQRDAVLCPFFPWKVSHLPL